MRIDCVFHERNIYKIGGKLKKGKRFIRFCQNSSRRQSDTLTNKAQTLTSSALKTLMCLHKTRIWMDMRNTAICTQIRFDLVDNHRYVR